jgi:hypothetical protein
LFHVSLIACLEKIIGQGEMRLRHAIFVTEDQSSRKVTKNIIYNFKIKLK